MARPFHLRYQAVTNESVGTGATRSVDIDCVGFTYVSLLCRLVGTVTIGDLTISAGKPFADELLLDAPLFAAENSDPVTAQSGNIHVLRRYRVSGLAKIRVTLTNNNVASKNLDVWVFIGTPEPF